MDLCSLLGHFCKRCPERTLQVDSSAFESLCKDDFVNEFPKFAKFMTFIQRSREAFEYILIKIGVGYNDVPSILQNQPLLHLVWKIQL